MNILTKYKATKEPVKDAVPVEDYSDIENNRLSLQFERLQSTKSKNNKNTVSVKNTLSENIFIRTKDTKEDVDSTESMLRKMNIMGVGKSLMIRKLYPEVSEEGAVKKVKEKRKSRGMGIGSLIIPGAILLSSQLPKLSKIPKAIKALNPIKKKEPEDIKKEEIFGLTATDKASIRKSKINNEKTSETLDRIIRLTSNGTVASLGGLIFGFNLFKQTDIYKTILKNMKEYSEGILTAFENIIKTTFRWFKDQIDWVVNTPERIVTGAKNIRDRALKYLDNLINTDDAEATNIKKSSIAKTLLKALRSMTVTFFGSGVPKDGVNNKKAGLDKDGNPISKVTKSNSNTESANSLSSDSGGNSSAGGDFDFTGAVKIDKAVVTNGIVSNLVVFKAFIEAGFGRGQAAVLTAEVGRENDFIAKTLFGGHPDPATGNNIGMISWQGKDRTGPLIQRLKAAGVLRNMKPFRMDQTYQSLMIMANYVMWEMKQGRFAKQEKTRAFLANKNITFNEAAPLLGGDKSYIGWARGQSTIKQKNGPRKKFDWKAHEARAAKHYNKLGKDVQAGGRGDGGEENFGDNEDTTPIVNSITEIRQDLDNTTSSDINEFLPTTKVSNLNVIKFKPDNISVADDYNISLPVNTRKEKTKRMRLPSKFTSNYMHDDSINEINNIIHRAPTPRINQKKHGNKDPQHPSVSPGEGEGNQRSLFDLMMSADISGNMLT